VIIEAVFHYCVLVFFLATLNLLIAVVDKFDFCVRALPCFGLSGIWIRFDYFLHFYCDGLPKAYEWIILWLYLIANI
jgi:hypothetical protein